MFEIQANTDGYNELQSLGLKPIEALKLYSDIRQSWFKFKRGSKAKRKATRIEHERDLVEFYNSRIAGKTWFKNYVNFRSFFNRNPPSKTVTESKSAQSRQREGFDFDQRVAKQIALDTKYLDVYTTAGSRSEFDVIAIPKGRGNTIFAQCKRNRRLDAKDAKGLIRFLSKAPSWAEVRIYYHNQEQITYSILRNENDVKWFATSSDSKRIQMGLKPPKYHEIVEASEVTASVDVKQLLERLKWTGSKSKFQEFVSEIESLWADVVGCRYNLAKNKAVDLKFSKLCSKYKANLGLKNYEVFKIFRLKQFEPNVETKKVTKKDFHREITGRTELAAFKAMKSGASFICRTDKTDVEIMHIIRLRGEKLEFAFCRASGLISTREFDKLSKYVKLLPKYVVGRFYFYINGKKCVFKDLNKNLEWFTVQRGVDLNVKSV